MRLSLASLAQVEVRRYRRALAASVEAAANLGTTEVRQAMARSQEQERHQQRGLAVMTAEGLASEPALAQVLVLVALQAQQAGLALAVRPQIQEVARLG